MFRALASRPSAVLLALACAPAAPAQSVTWTPASVSNPPPAVDAPASAFDPVSGDLVLFGGYNGFQHLSDTWVFDGSTWTQLAPPTSPPPRAAANMAYDEKTKTLVLFGGYDGVNYLGDTWLFDGATLTWTQASPTSSPPAVTGPSLFTDPLNGHVSLFGGYDGNFYQGTTWRWNGTTWRKLNPTTSPFARCAAVAATDTVRGKVVLFGGLGSVNPDNTWTWDGHDWTQESPTQQPALRYSSAAAFEPHLGEVVVFGGGSGGVDLDDTWAWTGSDWESLNPLQKPAAREAFAMAFDPVLDRIVIASGSNGATIYSDTWTFVDEFVDVGPGVGGSLGAPTLAGSGDLTPGTGSFQLTIGNALPSTPTLLFVGLANGALPFKGGTLYPFPLAVMLPIVTDGAGAATLPGSVPAGIPSGTTVFFQDWFADGSAPHGASGTNGLEAIVP